MATFLELQTRVLRRVIDTPASIQAEVPTLITEAMTDLQNRHNFFVMKEELAVTTTALTRSLGNVPADFKEWRDKPHYMEDMGNVVDLTLAPSVKEARALWGDDDEGDPDVLVVEDEAATGVGTLSVWPLPDANSDYSDGEYRLLLPYFKFLPTLSANGDTNWFTVHATLYLIFWATSEAFALDWDEKRSDFWKARAGEQLDTVVLTDKKRWLAGFDTLVPHTGAREPRIIR